MTPPTEALERARRALGRARPMVDRAGVVTSGLVAVMPGDLEVLCVLAEEALAARGHTDTPGVGVVIGGHE